MEIGFSASITRCDQVPCEKYVKNLESTCICAGICFLIVSELQCCYQIEVTNRRGLTTARQCWQQSKESRIVSSLVPKRNVTENIASATMEFRTYLIVCLIATCLGENREENKDRDKCQPIETAREKRVKLKKLTKEFCNKYPTVQIEKMVYAPSLGVTAYFKNNMYVLEAPRSMLHYPRLLKVNPVPYKDKQYYQLDGYVFSEHAWYAICHVRTCVNNKSTTVWYKFESLNEIPEAKDSSYLDQNHLQFLKPPERKATIIDILAMPFAPLNRMPFRGLVLRDASGQITGSFRMHGDITVSDGDTVNFNSSDNRLTTVDMYQNDTGNPAGIRVYEKLYKYFRFKNRKHHIVGNSPWFDNQVLLGCPPSFCIYAAFDAAAVLPDNTIVVFFGNYWWLFPSIKGNTDVAPNALMDLPVIGLGASIQSPVRAAFVQQKQIHLFTGKGNRVWVSELDSEAKGEDPTGRFVLFRQFQSEDILPNVRRDVWKEELDALLVDDSRERLFIFQDMYYYVYDLGESSFLTYLPLDERVQPRLISDFKGLPETIDAAIMYKNVYYFFHGTFVYTTTEITGPTNIEATVAVMQSSFFDCESYEYENLQANDLKSLSDYIDFLNEYEPLPAKPNGKFWSVKMILIFACTSLGVLVGMVVIAQTFSMVYSVRLQKKLKKQYEERNKFKRGKLSLHMNMKRLNQ